MSRRKSRKSGKLPKARPLPINNVRGEIINTIAANQVIIICGQTGCGKSTQVPQFLYEAGYLENSKQIACLHPRCVAAISLAERVAQEMNSNLGELVGYRVRFYRDVSDKTRIVFMTDGYLLRTMTDPSVMDQYSVVIIDEAHERSIQADIMLGAMRRYIETNKTIKLVIMSATLNMNTITGMFPEAKVVNVQPIKQQIAIVYEPVSGSDYVAAVVGKVKQIVDSKEEGNILIFLPTEAKIYRCLKILKGMTLFNVVLLPLHSRMDLKDRQRVFHNLGGRRKIVIATNIAETSLTIDGVAHVIDSGFVRRVKFDHKTRVECWKTDFVSVAEADQRKGRTGRTCSGKCYRLYSTEKLHGASDGEPVAPDRLFPTPEIHHACLSSLVMLLRYLNVQDIQNFPFIDRPDSNELHYCEQHLRDISLLRADGGLTKLGEKVSTLPLEPSMGKVAVVAADLGCRDEIAVILAMLTARYAVKRPKLTENISSDDGDLFHLLNIFIEGQNYEFSVDWCKEHGISYTYIKYARLLFTQLRRSLPAGRARIQRCNYENLIKKAFLSAFFLNMARHDTQDLYKTADGKTATIFHESCMKKDAEIVSFITAQAKDDDNVILRSCVTLNADMLTNMDPAHFKINKQLWKNVLAKILQ